jgi:hypothetical protein
MRRTASAAVLQVCCRMIVCVCVGIIADLFHVFTYIPPMFASSGELLVRHCLEEALRELGAQVDVVRSDRAFDAVDAAAYDLLVLDPWTWAGRGEQTRYYYTTSIIITISTITTATTDTT